MTSKKFEKISIQVINLKRKIEKNFAVIQGNNFLTLDFSTLISFLKKELIDLPGPVAHAIMAPYGRIPVNDAILNDTGIKKGAVAVLVYPKHNNSYIALIKRPDYNGVHGGQVSFPGGKKDETDISLLQTAIRETMEETGVWLNEGDFLHELTQVYIPPSNFLVTPFLFHLPQTPEFIPDAHEVKYMLEIPVGLLLDDNIVAYRDIKTLSGTTLKNVPYYQLGDEIIWGATAVILSEIKELIKGFK